MEIDPKIKDLLKVNMVENAEFQAPELKVHNTNYFDNSLYDWSTDADVVLVNCTWMDDDLLHRIAQKCCTLKKGTWIITIAKKLPSEPFSIAGSLDGVPKFDCVMSVRKDMGWKDIAAVHL